MPQPGITKVVTDPIATALLTQILAAAGGAGNNPVSGFEAAGDDDDAYNDIVTATELSSRMHVATGDGGVRVSLDGGSTVAFYVPANVERSFDGLAIAVGVPVKIKKYVDGGTVSTNTAVSVW
jgi:hypothetical protein